MRSLICTILVIITVFNCFVYAQTSEKKEKPGTMNVKELLDAMGIVPYPEKCEIESAGFPEEWLQVTPLTLEDIDEDFSNIEDLRWLEPIAKSKKVILFGETHYYRVIQHLRNRVLFALNTFDYFPLVVIEIQYSTSVFLDYYIGIEDDKEANEFYLNVIYDFVPEKEYYEFLEHLRRWNKTYPEKKIHIAGGDIEHDYKSTLSRIINPYFQSIDSSFYIEPDSIYTGLNLGDAADKLEEWLQLAKSKNKSGEFAFITPEYIECVIKNLRSSFLAHRYQFFYYRQRAIIRNLTDSKFLGNYFIEGKVMIWGGGYHTPTHFPYPDEGNFYREGSYLTYDFEPTKGKTYSVFVKGCAYSLGNMATEDLDSCLQCGSGYRYYVEKFQKAYKQDLISFDRYYLVNWKIDEFNKLIFKHAYENHHNPLLMNKFEWDNLIGKSKEISDELTKALQYKKDEYDRYDIIIYVPRSPFTELIKKRDF